MGRGQEGGVIPCGRGIHVLVLPVWVPCTGFVLDLSSHQHLVQNWVQVLTTHLMDVLKEGGG